MLLVMLGSNLLRINQEVVQTQATQGLFHADRQPQVGDLSGGGDNNQKSGCEFKGIPCFHESQISRWNPRFYGRNLRFYGQIQYILMYYIESTLAESYVEIPKFNA